MPDSQQLPRRSVARTVYAVTSGCYSDYTVVGIFDREQDAHEFVAAGMAEEVEEMTLYSAMPTIYTAYTATIMKRGGSWGQAGSLRVTDHRSTEEPKHTPADSDWSVTASGPDRERVVKSVTDRYAAWKAQQEGVA